MKPNTDPTLHPDDAAALDRLVEAGFDPAAVDAATDRRLAQVQAVLRRLEALPVEEPGADLTERTLGRIQRAIDEQEEALRVGPGEHTWWSSTIRKVGTVAAVMALGFAALWPAINSQNGPSGLDARQQNSIEAGIGTPFGASDWQVRADEAPLPGAAAPVGVVSDLHGYSGPVTIEARWVRRTVERADGTQVQVWQPVLVLVPLEEGEAKRR